MCHDYQDIRSFVDRLLVTNSRHYIDALFFFFFFSFVPVHIEMKIKFFFLSAGQQMEDPFGCKISDIL